MVTRGSKIVPVAVTAAAGAGAGGDVWLLLAPTSLDGDAMEARSWWWGMIKRRGLEDPFWGRTGTRRVRTTPRDGLGCWKKERRWRLGLWADRPKAMSLPLAFGGWRGKEFHSFMDEGKIDMWMMMTAASGPLAFELARLDRFGGEEVRAPRVSFLGRLEACLSGELRPRQSHNAQPKHIWQACIFIRISSVPLRRKPPERSRHIYTKKTQKHQKEYSHWRVNRGKKGRTKTEPTET